jgi:hypothetical protein
MAITLPATGSGTATPPVATDTVSGEHYQRVKLDIGADGATSAVTSGNPLPVSAASLPLPSGAATAAKQPALGTAGTASADVISVQGVASMTALKVDGSAVTQPVSAAALPLPSGAATSANQTTLIGHVDGIEGLLTTVAAAVAGTEVQVDVLTMPTVTVAAHAVTNAGTFAVQESGAALTALQLIDDAVATLGTTTYTEAASKGLTVGAVRRDADTTLVDTTNEVGPLQMDANGRLKVEVFSGEALPVSQSGTWDEVGIHDSGNSITVDNAQLSVVGGGTEAAALRVTIASDSTGVLSVDDNGGALTVDNGGTFATQATLQTGDNAVGRVKLTDGTDVADILDLSNSNPLTVAIVDGSGDQITSFGGGTQYTEDAAAAANPVGTVPILVRKDTPASEVSADGDNIAARGTAYGAQYVTLLDTGGSPVAVGGGTQYTEDAAAAANPIGTALNLVRADALAGVTSADGDNVAARGTDKGELYVKHVDAIPVTQSGTWDEVGIHDSGNSITVDNAALSVTGGGVEASALRVTLASDSTGVVSVDDNGGSLTVDGTVAVTGVSTVAEQQTQTTALQLIDDVVYTDDTSTHATGTSKGVGIMAAATPTDASVAANDIGMVAMTTDRKLHVAVMDALPAGTAAIGKLAANSGVDIGDVDILSIAAGDNNIGNVDIVSVPAPLSTTGGGTEATALRVTLASDSTGVVSIDDNAGSLTVDGTVTSLGNFTTVSTDVTRPADTTAYAINDALSDSTATPTTGGFTFTSAARASGGSGIITDAIITSSNDPATQLQGELFVFNQAVTAINDNAAFAVSDAEIKTCVARIPFTLEDVGNNGFFHATNLNMGFTASGSANLRFLVRVKNAYTPASSEVITFVLKILQVT